MSDLRERFHSLDRMSVPDLRAEIRHRPRRPPPSPRLAARLATALLALAIAAAGGFVVIRAFGGSERTTQRDMPRSLPTNGKIAFTGGAGGYAIQGVNPDGSGRVRLTDPQGASYDLNPEWSPDGKRIAFMRYEERDYYVYALDVETGVESRVSGDRSGESPTWSPTGEEIAYVGYERNGAMNVFVASADGSSERRLTSFDQGHVIGAYWSPDGDTIAFLRDYDILTVPASGGEPRQLTNTESPEQLPTWSPDGSRIAFIGKANEVAAFVMNADGSGVSRVVNLGSGNMGGVQWSPNAEELLFEAHDGTSWNIWTAPSDGNGRPIPIADSGADETGPVWAPDGTAVAFAAAPVTGRDNTGSFEVYVMRPDGRGKTQLTEDALEFGGDLSWQPLVSATPSLPAVDDSEIEARRTETIQLPGFPGAVAAGEGSVWVLVGDNPAPLEDLVRIDPRSDTVVARIPLEGVGWDSEIALGAGSVWVGAWLPGEGSAVVRVDAATNQVVATIPGAGGDLSFGAGSLWSLGTDDERSVVRIDPATNTIVDGVLLGGSPFDIAATNDAVWLLAHGEGQSIGGLLKLDPNSSEVVAEIDLDASGTSIAASSDTVWMPGWSRDFGDASGSAHDPVIARVGAATNEVLAPVKHRSPFRPFTADEDGVWFVRGWGQAPGVCRLNATTLEVDACADSGSHAPTYLVAAAFDPVAGTVWVSNDARTITRIDVTPAP